MPQLICPVCSTRFYTAHTDITLTERQKSVYRAVGQVCRDTQRNTARTSDVAAAVGWSVRTVLYELQYLEQIGEIERPEGPKSGWTQVEQPVVRIMVA